MVLLLGASSVLSGCGGEEEKKLDPSYADTLRLVGVTEDRVFVINRDQETGKERAAAKFLSLGQLDSRAYVCADGTTCKPAEGSVEQKITIQGVTRGQLIRYYLDNSLAEKWVPDRLACDPAKDTYALVARRLESAEKNFPERFELLVLDDVTAKVSVPANGAEGSFKLVPDGAPYPTGTCPEALTTRLAEVQAQADSLLARNRGGAGTPGTTTAAAPTTTAP
jgi:hypothetical protein